ncbi:DUF4367 domain-containing protein, partial [Eubacterium ventriosum]|uniref:DUF4367 domain-containing protein n=1 Tax=Eubacterium ventriosum TaxID=39496 RepID=UPI003AB49446
MNKKEDVIAQYSDEELQKEADEIRAIIENQPELQKIEMPEEVHISLMNKIKEYEEEKLRNALPERDKEALRIGRKVQNKRERAKRNKKALRRMSGLAAAVAVVIGVGVTSVGGKKLFVDVFEKNFGGEDKTYVESGDSEMVGEITEEQAWEEIKVILGEEPIRMTYKPKNTKFLNVVVDKDLQEATLFYSIGDKVLNFRIVSRYVKSSTGIEISDELVQEYVIELPETKINVKEYNIVETGEKEYIAQFTYKNSEYFLTGIINQAE